MKALCIDLFCGLGGWAEGFLAEGWDVIGFDIERHDYGTGVYPGQLVLQDVLTLHGSQFRKADCIVASPPCQAYSYRAMPWKRAKALSPPDNTLFDACFRIQWEAIEATRHECPACFGLGPRHSNQLCARCGGTGWLMRYIPLVVENVCGAQKWVGRAKWHYGSYYLWGDVPALMPSTAALKVASESGRSPAPGNGVRFTSRDCGVENKQPVWFNDDKRKCGGDWFGSGEDCSLMRSMSSRSTARKAASAQIAKIPFELAAHIARVYKPCVETHARISPTARTKTKGLSVSPAEA